jgi:hypothetical protein
MPAFTPQEFGNGVAGWPRGWPRDFHNAFYTRMGVANAARAFTAPWWPGFLHELSRWKATRGTRHAVITANALAQLPALAATWNAGVAPVSHLSLPGVNWGQIGQFFTIAAAIKPGRSPVFGSKFCHFLAPSIFPVVDWRLIGRPWVLMPYGGYVARLQTDWMATPVNVRNRLRADMAQLVPAAAPTYPWIVKIVELCLIGGHP